MIRCPKCPSTTLERSRAKTIFERVRRRYTDRRIFRCTSCHWRGWGTPIDPDCGSIPTEPISIDLESLDVLPSAAGRRHINPTSNPV
jgi:hypothetical protein